MTLLLVALGTSQFQFSLVYENTSSDLPMLYKLSALWSGNSGSLILWTFFLTMYTIMIAYSKKMVRNPMTPYVIAVILINTIFFYFILGFVTNPFELDRKSTRLNSSHVSISYAVFCLKKKSIKKTR